MGRGFAAASLLTRKFQLWLKRDFVTSSMPFGRKPYGRKPFGRKPFGRKPFGRQTFGWHPQRLVDRMAGVITAEQTLSHRLGQMSFS